MLGGATSRRNFLRLLGIAPVAAPIAAAGLATVAQTPRLLWSEPIVGQLMQFEPAVALESVALAANPAIAFAQIATAAGFA